MDLGVIHNMYSEDACVHVIGVESYNDSKYLSTVRDTQMVRKEREIKEIKSRVNKNGNG